MFRFRRIGRYIQRFMTPTAVALQDVDFAALTRELRRKRGLTQEQLARALEVTFGTVNGWENGRHEPIAALGRRLVEMADAAGLDALPMRSSHSLSEARRPARRRRSR